MEDKEQIIECADCTSKCNCFYNFLNYRLEQLARKTQECEELKNKLACQININNHLADYQVTANKLMDYYRKALEEIENNINKYFEESFYKNCRYAKGCTSACGLATNRVFNQILNIINKAEGKELYEE